MTAILTCLITISLACYLLQATFYRANWKTLARDALNAETQLLFMGSSTFYFGIDPRLYSHAVNLSTNYMSCELMQDLWVLHRSKLSGVRQVVLEENLSTYFYDTMNLDPLGPQDLGLPFWPKFRDFYRGSFLGFDQAVHRLLAPIFAWRFTPAFFAEFAYRMDDDQEPKHQVPGYIPSELKLAIPAAYAQREVEKAQGHVEQFGDRYYADNLPACKTLVQDLHARKIQVTFLRMPQEEELRKIYPMVWEQRIESAQQSLQRLASGAFASIDARVLEGASAADFRDPDHLNRFGAQKLASYLGLRLQALLSVSTQ